MTDKTKEAPARSALKLALEALEVATTSLARDRQEVLRAQAAIREALAQSRSDEEKPAQQQQEPVAWMIWTHGPVLVFMNKDEAKLEFDRLNHAYPEPMRMLVPLYTSPPAPNQCRRNAEAQMFTHSGIKENT